MSDFERTQRLGELLRRRYFHPGNGQDARDVAGRWVVLDEVPNSTGFVQRTADYVAVGLWPSDGLALIGHELKVSRGDLKRELADLSKAHESGHYCDAWWLVIWDAKMLDGLNIPPVWGIMARQGAESDDGSLHVIRKAQERPKAERGVLPREVVAVLLRRAARLSVGAWQVSEAVRQAARRSYDEGKRRGGIELENDLEQRLKPLVPAWRAATKANDWKQPTVEELCDYAATLAGRAA